MPVWDALSFLEWVGGAVFIRIVRAQLMELVARGGLTVECDSCHTKKPLDSKRDRRLIDEITQEQYGEGRARGSESIPPHPTGLYIANVVRIAGGY